MTSSTAKKCEFFCFSFKKKKRVVAVVLYKITFATRTCSMDETGTKCYSRKKMNMKWLFLNFLLVVFNDLKKTT